MCTHTITAGSECLACKQRNADKRAYLRSRGLNRNQKLGATKVFYNPCQLFEHMKMHDITMLNMGNLMLMPLPAGMSDSDWTTETDMACEALMEFTFILRVHIMDWLKSHNIEDKWWRLLKGKNDVNVISKIVNGYQGREIFKRVEKPRTNQFIEFDSPDTENSNSSIDEFDDASSKNEDSNGASVSISDKNVTENEDNPCMLSDITFVDCGTMPHYFEPEQAESRPTTQKKAERSDEPKRLMGSKPLAQPASSLESESALHQVSKKQPTDVEKSRDVARQRPANKVQTNSKGKLLSEKDPKSSSVESDAVDESHVAVKDANKKCAKPSFQINVQQCKAQSLLRNDTSNVDKSVEVSRAPDKAVKIGNLPVVKKNVLFKLNLNPKQVQSLLTNNPYKLKSNKTQGPNDRDAPLRIIEIPSRDVLCNKKAVLGTSGENSHGAIALGKNSERTSTGEARGGTDNYTPPPEMMSTNAKRKQIISGNTVLKADRNFVARAAINFAKHPENSPSVQFDSNKDDEVLGTQQTTSLHSNASCLTSSQSSSVKEANNRNNSIAANRQEAMVDFFEMYPHLVPMSAGKYYFEEISLTEQENGQLHMHVKGENRIKCLNRNVCDRMFKLRQEMISNFQHLNAAEFKKRMDHLQQADEETRRIFEFLPYNIFNEKLRALSTLQRILNENFRRPDDNARDDTNDDTMLTAWQADVSGKNLCKLCGKMQKPKSYSIGFSKLPKDDDDAYCICYKYVCYVCKTCLNDLVQFVAHLNLHKKIKPYTCPDCYMKFTCNKRLEAHIWSVCFHMLKKRVFACKICEIDGFKDKESVIRHYLMMHGDIKVACKDCNNVFSSYGEYKTHYTQAHSPEGALGSMVQLVVCELTGMVIRDSNYLSYLEDFQGIRKIVWLKCPFCSLIAVENKHIISVFKHHLRNMHWDCLPKLVSQEALALIFGAKYAQVFTKIHQALSVPSTVVPKIVNTETITSETFERVSQGSFGTPSKLGRLVDTNSDTAGKGKGKEKMGLLPKILDVRSIALDPKRSESKRTAAQTGAKEKLNLQAEVSNAKNSSRLRESVQVTIGSDGTSDSQSDIEKEIEVANDKGNNGSQIASRIRKPEKSPSTETNDVRVNSTSESSKSDSNSDSAYKANTDGRIKLVDIRKICKPDIEPLVTAELCELEIKDENESHVASVPQPPPLARIPQYLLRPAESESTSLATRAGGTNEGPMGRVAIHGPTAGQEGAIDYLCHLCDEEIDTSQSVVRTHFSRKHPEYELATITTRLRRISRDFINGGYKRHLASSRKRRSDNALFVSKKKRRWTPKKYVDLSAPVGLCVERETAEDGDGNFKCKRCGQCCTDMSDLREHIAANHRLKGRYLICLECGENFVVAPSLQMHLKAFHGIEDPIVYMSQNPSYAPDVDGDSEAEGKTTVANQCHVCMAVFEDKAAVDKHLRVHGMAFLNRKRIEARNAQKTQIEEQLEKGRNADTVEDKPSAAKDNPNETAKRDKPAEAILEKLNVS